MQNAALEVSEAPLFKVDENQKHELHYTESNVSLANKVIETFHKDGWTVSFRNPSVFSSVSIDLKKGEVSGSIYQFSKFT